MIQPEKIDLLREKNPFWIYQRLKSNYNEINISKILNHQLPYGYAFNLLNIWAKFDGSKFGNNYKIQIIDNSKQRFIIEVPGLINLLSTPGSSNPFVNCPNPVDDTAFSVSAPTGKVNSSKKINYLFPYGGDFTIRVEPLEKILSNQPEFYIDLVLFGYQFINDDSKIWEN
jgi:hypothetical protein